MITAGMSIIDIAGDGEAMGEAGRPRGFSNARVAKDASEATGK